MVSISVRLLPILWTRTSTGFQKPSPGRPGFVPLVWISARAVTGERAGNPSPDGLDSLFWGAWGAGLYLQTWSGNTRMIRCAMKLGFQEVCRKPGTDR